MGRLLRSLLSGFALGAPLAAVPLVIEHLHRGFPLRVQSLAGLALLGGIVSGLGHAWLARGRNPARSLALTLLVSGALPTLLLVFYANIVILPGTPFYHPSSLLWDGLVTLGVLVPVGAAALLVDRRAWKAGEGSLAVFGGVCVGSCLAVVGPCWPSDPTTPARPGTGPDLMIVVLDAVRRDHTGLHGYGRPTTPALDRLAPSARVFTRGYAASSWTPESAPVILHASVRGRSRPLARVLADNGYTTGCFSDNPLFERGSALAEGFDRVGASYARSLRFAQRVFEGSFVAKFALRWPLLAFLWNDQRLVDEAAAWSRRIAGPIFLYVHLMDAHQPYRYPSLDGRGWSGRTLYSPQTGMSLTAAERLEVISHYDGGIRAADAQVPRLLDALKARGRQYVAIVTADHGESLGEGGRWGHAQGLHAELLGVPLLVLGRDVTPGSVDRPVGHASIGTTLLAAAQVERPERRGDDLRTSDGSPEVTGAFGAGLAYTVRDGYKLILDRRTGAARLYDIAGDPEDAHDLSDDLPEVARKMASGLGMLPAEAAISAAEVERLHALGYLGGRDWPTSGNGAAGRE
jgi:arylsulfatase A-like enzyme